MDIATASTATVAGALGLLISADLAASAVRNRDRIRRRLDHPARIVVGSTICATLLLGAARPILAATPPPAVRLVSDTTGPATVVVHAEPAPATESHTVEPGDSLWRIARSTLIERGLPSSGIDVARFWPAIYDANREVIGADPHLIHPGQVLVLPAHDRTEVHRGA